MSSPNTTISDEERKKIQTQSTDYKNQTTHDPITQKLLLCLLESVHHLTEEVKNLRRQNESMRQTNESMRQTLQSIVTTIGFESCIKVKNLNL